MKNIRVYLVVLVFIALHPSVTLNASEEDFASWQNISFESFDIHEAGKVAVDASANKEGIVSFNVTAFAQSFLLNEDDLKKIHFFPLNSLSITHEAGYPELGGYTVHFKLQRIYYDESKKLQDERAIVSISKGKGLEVTVYKNENGHLTTR